MIADAAFWREIALGWIRMTIERKTVWLRMLPVRHLTRAEIVELEAELERLGPQAEKAI